ncbi:MAG: inositol monophosphatase [Sphaerochaetaceae bacterium]|nr:inositol monophosphatase [Sphaerochaetaceae bacterium]
MFVLEEDKLDVLAAKIRKCGEYAKERQKDIHRSFKADGSVLTETDLEVSTIIENTITTLFPECTFVSEEFPIIRRENAPYIFVLDPIDGTDVYSQGLGSFAVSLGILDEHLNPVGAIISCPRFGLATDELFIRLDPGKELLVNGEAFSLQGDKDEIKQILIGSNHIHHIDFTSFKGKARSFGSSIIHLFAPALISQVQGAILPPVFVWDIAASHAILKHLGMDIEYCDGSEFVYTDEFVYEKKKFKMDIYAGSKTGREKMRKFLPIKLNRTTAVAL